MINITYEENFEYVIAGKSHTGRISDSEMKGLFNEMRSYVVEEKYSGPLVMVWPRERNLKRDSLEVFVGIQLQPGETPPASLDTTSIEMNGLVRAAIRRHTIVMPSPLRIIDRIEDYAENNNYRLQDLVIDKYFSDSIVYTEIPIKK